MKRSLALLVGLLIIGTTAGIAGAQPIGSEQIKPQDAGGYWEIWKIEEVEDLGLTYGPWRTLDEAVGYAGQSYSFSTWVSWSHEISGTVMVTYNVLSATLGFDVLASGAVQVTISGEFEHDGQIVAFQVRPKYNEYMVTQRKYIHIDGRDYPMDEKEKVWVKKFLLYQHQAQPLN
ncbi:MAG: hypothetical protein J7K57_03630 [Palaeococcus sp.]|uniref:hypothetical protein n=1 Tax=Palaeococcus sp. (in: euryarchaeotes) TaxID=2820298 RepID=UPI0025EAB0D7|nr:hypothetical protein [Palaeococcus sp. (in: euryarchaeotes)]MCD6558949.1 hypothetical protein [Palaeococcus sp. (in: euryarchaeotes)]